MKALGWLRAEIAAKRERDWYQTRQLTAARQIKTHMTENEKRKLYELAEISGQRGSIIEVGSYLGASSSYLASGLANSKYRLYCVDTWANDAMPEGLRNTYVDFKTNTASFGAKITQIQKASQNLLRSDIEGPINMIFLDGDHSYGAVSTEVKQISPWLEPGGVLAFHDILYYEGVRRAVSELLRSMEWNPKGVVDNLIWFVKGG